MLTFQVLEQENIDVRPYRVDHKWYFARYEGSRCKKEYYDVPYGLFFNVPRPPTKINHPMKYYKYTYTETTELKVHHVCSHIRIFFHLNLLKNSFVSVNYNYYLKNIK